MPVEARGFTGQRQARGTRVDLGDQVTLQVSGVGAVRARAAAQSLLESGARALVSWGTAGAMHPALRCGDLVLPARVLAPDRKPFETDPAWRQRLADRLGGYDGDLLESPTVLDATAKQLGHRDTGAIAVDMESAAIAAEARDAGVPFVAVRVVLDAAAVDIPWLGLAAWSRPWPRRAGALARVLVKSPPQLVGLARLAWAGRRTRIALRGVVRRTGSRLMVDGR